MAHLIKLPSVAADTSGGTLHQWLKKEGDTVAVGDALAEIETEKAIVEINAEQAGVLGRIVIQAGAASVPVNTVIGVLLAQGEDASAIDRALAEAGAAAQPAAAPAPEPAPAAVTAPAPTAPATPSQISNPPSAAPVPGGRLFASPLARRLAAQWHVDLLGVTGTGPHGRIVRRDVEAARDRAPASAAAPLAGRAASRRVPHTGMRRAIARRLTESKQNVPHFYLTVDCRMDALLALRAQANQGGTVKLSVNDFIVRAAALALREVPEVNASWQEDAVEYHAGADISVAVATDGGLVTPIVRDADVKPLSAIAGEIVELAGRAKINRLKPEEFTGGSLTVSNLGMYGISQFAAIINPPQAAILAVGAAEKRPVVDSEGQLVAATVMTVTLSADHRVVDGAVGARWLAAFRALIENPVRILL
ncbi:Dihydrolipoyllysine-residue succinyltransferase component of 2-oxoglutarate dehydrogenase complex [Achromobacter insolitus]|uniref:pyruvate dehydrogenase complex dihydrolipoamide acetyltransferase n=1 Tax=Achromobacter insolitus TaxID=217204 RepID=UPI000972C831|nr:pyruvate dehydrogenase complex dihydrolipoamide acetyltransferase [Achromobacter insolitus]APX78356.1 pyruvate dehydrogenase complex dihydrolipoamide acetyltransferase [Achromobacter insolitus]OWT62844.1 pyruvate dehydrogenase complex dihydrolipoamide acetyltransferase [Achromobacter insolitus]CAB3654612.1 Dihydrolipoyllysine-residue succinyltransferase component of 2-oxoglutarate dehydrogenase complex [Achromobacter insolitus]VEG65981.1 Dihydrolipoyllysine-residue succinyltransferase compon